MIIIMFIALLKLLFMILNLQEDLKDLQFNFDVKNRETNHLIRELMIQQVSNPGTYLEKKFNELKNFKSSTFK